MLLKKKKGITEHFYDHMIMKFLTKRVYLTRLDGHFPWNSNSIHVSYVLFEPIYYILDSLFNLVFHYSLKDLSFFLLRLNSTRTIVLESYFYCGM